MAKSATYLLYVHTVPPDLAAVLNKPSHHLYENAQIYQKLVDSDLLWRIWQIDAYGSTWVDVNFINAAGKAEFHSVKVDEGTYDRIEFEEYSIR